MSAKISKGFSAEENLRAYFLWLGYYVLRGVKLKRDAVDLTDIDLLLIGRSSPLSRERINVDSKNKKSPQAAERVFFANGIRATFSYERCIVATTSTSAHVSAFSEENNVTFLDGNFLKKLPLYSEKYNRIKEEALIESLKQDDNSKIVNNYIREYELAKARLAFSIDFSTISELLSDCKSFSSHLINDYSHKIPLCRCVYFMISLFLIALDYINKDLVILSDSEREKRIYDGFMFGSLGRKGCTGFINKAFSVIKPFTKLGDTEIHFAKKALEDAYALQDTKILGEFFSKTATIKDLFKSAREIEQLAFALQFISPQNIPLHLRSILFVLLDYFGIDRMKFVDSFK